jgi:phage terminase small subunit
VAEENLISAGEVLSQIRAIAMANATDLLAVREGQLEIQSTDQLSSDARKAIASIEKSTGGLKVKFYDKLKALELLGKYLGLFDRRDAPQEEENDLIQAILDSTKEVIATHDLPEVQQAPAAGNDLVEPPGSS